jgi:tryptophan synthase alpha chain
MNRLSERLAQVKSEGKKILVPFITGDYPDRETFVALLLETQNAGADAVEVGVPFSDPSADGPVIQRASECALAGGASVSSLFESVKTAREQGLTIPLVYMTYYNPILHRGGEKFAADAVASGGDGVLIVDLPPEEADEFAPIAREAGLATVFLAAPTTPVERLPQVIEQSSGFLYCVSVTGVTGEKEAAADLVRSVVGNIRPLTELPVLVGFGISGPEPARQIAAVSDGVIVGSALLEAVGDKKGEEAVAAAGAFLRSLREALELPAPEPKKKGFLDKLVGFFK